MRDESFVAVSTRVIILPTMITSITIIEQRKYTIVQDIYLLQQIHHIFFVVTAAY